MELIFNVLSAIGGSIASFWADHPLAAALVTLIALGVFWQLMGWRVRPDFSNSYEVAKNGLIVLVGWAIAVPILDFLFSIFAELFGVAKTGASGIFWLWEQYNSQPIVVLACLGIAIVCFIAWAVLEKRLNKFIKACACILGFVVLVGIAVPIANTFSEEPSEMEPTIEKSQSDA